METFWMMLKAFLVGGALCAIGQIFIDYTKLTPARILTWCSAWCWAGSGFTRVWLSLRARA